MIQGVSPGNETAAFNKAQNAERLKRTCSEFESIFLGYMMKTMRKTVPEGILGRSSETKIFNAMFDEGLSLEIARGGGIGLGKMLYERLGEYAE